MRSKVRGSGLAGTTNLALLAPVREGLAPAFEPVSYLERLRRSGIRVDREGRFIHEGEEVRHEGLKRALFRWLDTEPDGRVVLEYAALARGEDPGLEDAVTGFADKHAGPAASGETADAPEKSST